MHAHFTQFLCFKPSVNTTWFEERTCMKCPSSNWRQETNCLLMKGFFSNTIALIVLVDYYAPRIHWRRNGNHAIRRHQKSSNWDEPSLRATARKDYSFGAEWEKNSHKWSRITFLHMLRLYGIFMLWSWIACQRRKHNITVPCGNWDVWCWDDSEILRRRSWRLHWIRSPYAAVDWPVAKKPLLSCGLASMCHPYLHLD